MVRCVVSGCPNRAVDVNANRGILSRAPKRFFSFPKDAARVKVWLAALRETDKQDSTEEHLICEDHFLPEDISANGVKSDAIPIMSPYLDGPLGMISAWGAELSEEEDQWAAGGGGDGADDAEPPAPESPAVDPLQQDPAATKSSGAETTGLHATDVSLGLLTQSFLELLLEAPDGLLDLRQVTTSLKTRRRRVYDITNVLEGISLIEKASPNKFKWIGGCEISSFLWKTQREIQRELDNLKLVEDTLDALISSCAQQLFDMTDDEENAALAYLTHEDISRFGAFQEQTVIVVKAPEETELAVPAPSEDSFQVYLKGGKGPIVVRTCDIGTGEKSGCFLALEESRIATASLHTDSESDDKDLIEPEADLSDDGAYSPFQVPLMGDETENNGDGFTPGPPTSVATPPCRAQRGCSTRRTSAPVSRPQPPLPVSESTPPLPDEDEDKEEEEEEDDDDDDDGDSDYTPGPSTSITTPASQSQRGCSKRRVYNISESDSEDDDYAPRPSTKAPRPKKRRRRGRPTSRVREEEEDRWRDRKESDKGPGPLTFRPAREPGPNLDTTASWSPLSLFQQFFSASAVHTIIANTNANAAERLQAGLRFEWKSLTVSDFYIFLAIIIFSGLVKVHNRANYWKKEWPHNFRYPGDTMTQDRFESILWALHLSNPAEDQANERKRNTAEYDRLFKIKPLYTEIVNACKALFQPYQNIAIDERMVASKAHISMKQYMMAKPPKWGYKLFVLTDSLTAYTWNFLVYDGKRVGHPVHGLSYTLVMDLMDFPLLGQGYTLYVNSSYSSRALFEELSRQKTGACGPIRKKQIGFPQSTQNDLPRHAARGDMRWMRQNKLLFVKWMDALEVDICSTVHEAFSGQTVKRRVKAAGAWKIKDVAVPDAVLKYNQNMGGVDLSERLIGYYSVHHKTMKWYKTFFYYFVDIAVVNSFLLHKQLHKKTKKDPAMKKPLTQKCFRVKLAAEMLEFAKASATPPPPPTPTSCMPAYYGDDGSQSRRYCKRCQNAGIKRMKTPVYCMGCEVPLCLTSQRNCFRDWHSK